jgi:UDP-2,3-diacylglucosamine hydrolase
MKDAYYFISDAHLGLGSKEEERQKEKVLLKFLEEIKKDALELFIVGDLFDFWIEYGRVVPKGHYRVLAKIAELVEEGVKITYIAGNHDFWRSRYFPDEFGIEIDDKHIERVIENKKFYIHHGDGLAYNDTAYRVLKKILRNPFSQFFYSLIHPDIGIWLAKKSSSTSRMHTSKKDYSQKDGLRDFGLMKTGEGFDYVIMGHRHLPEVTEKEGKAYINLGDWMENFTYGIFRNGKFELRRYFDLNTKQFTNEVIT